MNTLNVWYSCLIAATYRAQYHFSPRRLRETTACTIRDHCTLAAQAIEHKNMNNNYRMCVSSFFLHMVYIVDKCQRQRGCSGSSSDPQSNELI